MSSTKNSIFQFKQFAVDQTGCAMKINTDGTLLAVLSESSSPETILDIGTGTGVIALMLAQRFPDAHISAVEIEELAALRARENFRNSPFATRLSLFHSSFQDFSASHPDDMFDLIVSNPPFFINSLKNPNAEKQTARHADNNFFTNLISFLVNHLSPSGVSYFVLPLATADFLIAQAKERGLHQFCVINIRSFTESEIHRVIIGLTKKSVNLFTDDFTIYSSQKEYSIDFVNKMKYFFKIF